MQVQDNVFGAPYGTFSVSFVTSVWKSKLISIASLFTQRKQEKRPEALFSAGFSKFTRTLGALKTPKMHEYQALYKVNDTLQDSSQ